MFQKGDLIWIPSETVLLVPNPNTPQAIRITKQPEIGLFIEVTKEDQDFLVIVSDGRKWVANKKFIKHLRSDHVS